MASLGVYGAADQSATLHETIDTYHIACYDRKLWQPLRILAFIIDNRLAVAIALAARPLTTR